MSNRVLWIPLVGYLFLCTVLLLIVSGNLGNVLDWIEKQARDFLYWLKQK